MNAIAATQTKPAWSRLNGVRAGGLSWLAPDFDARRCERFVNTGCSLPEAIHIYEFKSLGEPKDECSCSISDYCPNL
jgi:hypothetical protein